MSITIKSYLFMLSKLFFSASIAKFKDKKLDL